MVNKCDVYGHTCPSLSNLWLLCDVWCDGSMPLHPKFAELIGIPNIKEISVAQYRTAVSMLPTATQALAAS